MKILLLTVLLGVARIACTQSYVDSGIRHYNSGEYQEALVDLKEAENVKSIFTDPAVAKLYFYKGMSMFKLKNPSKMSMDDMLAIHESLKQAVDGDSAMWYMEASGANSELFYELSERAEDKLKEAAKQKDRDEKILKFEEYHELLNKCVLFRNDPGIELLHAKAYHEMGDLFFENASEFTSLQKASGYFQKAIHAYEIARYNDPFSKSIIKVLLELSLRTDDPDRVKEYTQLLDLAGG